MAGDPAAEGTTLDCSLLEFYEQTCPDPSGEGDTIAPYGVEVCNRYAYERQDSAAILYGCLLSLTEPDSGWCGLDHIAEVDSCVAGMNGVTCASTTAETVCESISSRCSLVTEAECVADLSPMGDSMVEMVDPCMESVVDDYTCYLSYGSCAGLPDPAAPVAEVCEEFVLSGCEVVTAEACALMLDPDGTTMIRRSAYNSIAGCASTMMEADETMSCDLALAACIPLG